MTIEELWEAFLPDGIITIEGTREQLEATRTALIKHKFVHREDFEAFHGKGRLQFTFKPQQESLQLCIQVKHSQRAQNLQVRVQEG